MKTWEYIVRMPPDMPYDIRVELNAWYIESEPIARCRDCIYSHEDSQCTSTGWVDVIVCESKQWSTSGMMPNHTVKPDGFCAWGEPRD